MVPCLHDGNVYIKRKLQVWRVQNCISLVSAKTALTCAGLQVPHLMGGIMGLRTESCGNSGLTFAMVSCLHQSNVYINRKLRVWRVQKFIPLVFVKTALTCAGLQTTPFDFRRYWPEKRNLGPLFAMIPCLHQSNVYIKRNLRVCRVQQCIPLLGSKTALTCADLRQYKAENGDLRNFGSTFRHGTMFAPKQSLYQKEATGMESPKCIPLVGAKTILTYV